MKDGDRRQKEGLPRNFLLVDEYTKKPYGVGVGDWRKEVMLLSRDLDPAIGNINRQPEGAIADIAEWIQRTWEYSFPMKQEYVKEVIARGVTLRRGELWKMIRNGEPKPSTVSDKTWRTLERQLENPASIKKFEDCRKANASRMNFGRTGPSGEVGVRQKLRRILKRSPDPEEIRFEMGCDKGYGGRHQNKQNNLNVMHGSGSRKRSIVDTPRICTSTGNSEERKSTGREDEEEGDNESQEKNYEDIELDGSGEKVIEEKVIEENVLSLSAEEVVNHPLVMMMMQRLKALEERGADPMSQASNPEKACRTVMEESQSRREQ